jgi:hypothetical protein
MFVDRRPHESGVALRFPPQSMTSRAITNRMAIPFASWTAPAKRSEGPMGSALFFAEQAIMNPYPLFLKLRRNEALILGGDMPNIRPAVQVQAAERMGKSNRSVQTRLPK